jgi:hypothetical protein
MSSFWVSGRLNFRTTSAPPLSQHPDATNTFGLLSARRDGPRRHRACKSRDELAPLHSITSSARASSLSGTVRPSILAVSALITSSNFDDCTTGKSAGFSPLSRRPA